VYRAWWWSVAPAAWKSPGVQLVDTPTFPEAYKPYALAHREAFNRLQAVDDLDWTFFSPAAEIGPGEERGQYRVQPKAFLADASGHSRISYADYGAAFVAELEAHAYRSRSSPQRIDPGTSHVEPSPRSALRELAAGHWPGSTQEFPCVPLPCCFPSPWPPPSPVRRCWPHRPRGAGGDEIPAAPADLPSRPAGDVLGVLGADRRPPRRDLVNAQFGASDARKLVELIRASGKQLTTIYISHGDPDYYFGLATLQDAFPQARIVATAQTVAHIQQTQAGKLAYWGPKMGADVRPHRGAAGAG
jgi:hypothetical protein